MWADDKASVKTTDLMQDHGQTSYHLVPKAATDMESTDSFVRNEVRRRRVFSLLAAN